MIKRLIDVLFAVCMIIALSPLLLLVAALIRLQHDGDVLFLQKRVGFKGVIFRICKFRTMRHRNPDEIDQRQELVVSATNDARITRLGRHLRSMSIDELPQLFNVLSGSMSLVGPRPIIPEQLDAIPDKEHPRFNVKPGITGWAQINGRRSLDWIQQLNYDAWYAKNHNLLLDFRILIATLVVVVRRSDTYGSKSSNWRSYLSTEEKGE